MLGQNKIFLINTPESSMFLGGLFGGLSYGAINFCTSGAVNQAVHAVFKDFLIPVLGSPLGYYMGLGLAVFIAAGIGAFIGYLLFQKTVQQNFEAEVNELTNVNVIPPVLYEYPLSLKPTLPVYISFHEFTDKEIYKLVEDEEDARLMTRL